MSAMRFITIQFTDGSKVRFSFPVQAANKAAQQMKIEDFLKGQHFVVQTEARLIVYPVASIRSLEFSTGGENLEGIKLPLHTLRNATLVSS